MIFESGHQIVFAHTSFKWANLASHNAGVTVVIVGITNKTDVARRLYSEADDGRTVLLRLRNAGQIGFTKSFTFPKTAALRLCVSPIAKLTLSAGTA